MYSRSLKIFRVTVGFGLVAFSLLACAVSLIAIIDPVGTQMADDGDPFGTPPSRFYSVLALGVFASLGAVGFRLTLKLPR